MLIILIMFSICPNIIISSFSMQNLMLFSQNNKMYNRLSMQNFVYIGHFHLSCSVLKLMFNANGRSVCGSIFNNYIITFVGDRIASRESAYLGVKPMQGNSFKSNIFLCASVCLSLLHFSK